MSEGAGTNWLHAHNPMVKGIAFSMLFMLPPFGELQVIAVTGILTYTCGPMLGGLTLATLSGIFSAFLFGKIASSFCHGGLEQRRACLLILSLSF
jgi:hypothetical protein